MKKFTLLAVTLVSSAAFCQVHSHEHTNEAVPNQEVCGNNAERDIAFKANPHLQIQDNIDQASFEVEYQQYLQNYDPYARVTKTVPVVIHIVHEGGPENISDDQVFDALMRLNEDFDMTNDDLPNTVASFIGITGFTDFDFKLATKDPSGNCHPGITRTIMAGGGAHDTGDNSDIRNAVQNAHGNWPQNKYMNVFVVKSIVGSAAYTNNPGNWYSASGMGGSIYMGNSVMGSMGTSSFSNRHILSHEVGHWFNLSHCWGSNNNAGQSSSCSTDDGVADTPNTIGWLGICNLTGVSCSSLDNVQNIMDYAGSCRTMFTQGQAARMQNSINGGTAQRNNLWQTANLIATGTLSAAPLCEAEFSSNLRTICAGQSIDFSDDSYHNVTGRTWTFPGGSPGSSTVADPTVTYNSPGIYSVTIDATDGSTNAVTTKTDYIVVLSDPGESLPHHEGFEFITAIPDNDNWMVLNDNGLEAWQLSTVAGAGYTTNSAYLNNYGNADGSKDELISGSIDLSGVSPGDAMFFSFEYAYRLRFSGNDEWLRFYISKDCGETWALRKNIHADALSPVVATGAYLPTFPEEWYYVEITNVNSDYYVSNFRYKFEFENDDGNNIYIDNINMYPTSMSALVENDESQTLRVFPNPVSDVTNIQFSGIAGPEYTVSIHSTLGQEVQQIFQGQLTDGLNTIEYNSADLAKGVYLVRIESEGRLQTVKLIKE